VTSPRAVVLVGGPAAPYSRALRIATALAHEGYEVEIAAVAATGLADVETGPTWTLRRYRPSGRWAAVSSSPPAPGPSGGPVRPVAWSRKVLGTLRRWILWPHTVRGWWATLARELPPADLYHACGSLTVAPALQARRRSPTGPGGRRAFVIYDAIDDVFESNNVLDMPRPVRAWHARRESRWARDADAVLTVNEPLAGRLSARWGLEVAVVPNYPEVPADLPRDDRLRREAGLAPGIHIALFQGRTGPRLGLDEAAEAALLVPDCALVILGFGRGFERERARDGEPRFAGRHVTLAARPPDELIAWTAGADVAVVPLPPVSVNQRLSSPNKFWEAIAAGTPVVVGAGLEYMADLVRADDLGLVADSSSAADLASAIERTLDRSRREPDWRAHIREVAARRYSWPIAEATYHAVVRRAP